MRKKILLFILSVICLLGFDNVSNAQKSIQLFNGKNLSNWNLIVENNKIPGEEVFFVKNGTINIKGKPIGYMYTKEKYSNYKLHVEWRWPQGIKSNSGIFLLIADPKNPFPNGVECQLKAGTAGDFVLLGGSELAEFTGPRPKFPVVKKQNASSEVEPGEWNHANIFVKNGVITVYINGTYQNVGTNKVKEGHIGLQSEGGAVEFRNVTLTLW